jgi:cell filamentation protein
MFCSAQYIKEQMGLFDLTLASLTPCRKGDQRTLAAALATVHGEFILIHPFREGNGRVGRWIATIMALQADEPILEFEQEATDLEAKKRYFSAIRRYPASPDLLIEWFSGVLSRS